jgi:hypothetical protein
MTIGVRSPPTELTLIQQRAKPGLRDSAASYRVQDCLAVIGFLEPLPGFACLIDGDETLMKRNPLQERDLNTLTVLDCADELAGLQEAVVRAGIEPGIASPRVFDEQVDRFHVEAVEISDLEFASRRGLQIASELDDAVVVENTSR